MLSEAQRIEKERNILTVVNMFIQTDKTIEEISELTNISSSSVQRYLNEKEYILDLLDEETYLYIQAKLKQHKEIGNSTGGKKSQENNYSVRNITGQFVTNRRK